MTHRTLPDHAWTGRAAWRQLHAAWLVVLLAALHASGCARNPVTGQLQPALISEAQEVEMGRQAAVEVQRTIGLVDDPQLQGYIQSVGERMARASERPELPWTFGVVDDPTPNAFALPGGFIYFTRGMMNLMDSEAELASVLGHEIGHVTARHQVAAITRGQLAQIGLGVGAILFPQLEQLAGLAGAGLQLLFLSYGRDAERQADDLGFRYALEQGYDVRQMADVFATLQRLGEGQQRSALPAWLSTHPAPAERIQAVEERLATVEQPEALGVRRAEYLERIHGLIYGVNPRNGFFRDGHFLHPDLRFQLAFPGPWQRQNMAQVVMAVSPQQDAAIQLTLSGEASAVAAAQRFLQQQGMQAGPATRETINGLAAVVAAFQAQTAQGALRGLAAFIEYQNRVYQILGYSPAAVYAQNERTFRQSLGSFASLTDPAILALQPDRISIVRVSESMTLAEFHRRFPSVIPIAELAIINQVAGPETVIPAGTQLKRVVGGG